MVKHVTGVGNLRKELTTLRRGSEYNTLCMAAGITRLSELTYLDRLSIPVWSCSRPDAMLWQVSAGKGLTADHAIISCVFEAVETFSVESWIRRRHVIQNLSSCTIDIPEEYIRMESVKLLGANYEFEVSDEPAINSIELKSSSDCRAPLCWGYLSQNARLHGFVTNGLSSSLSFKYSRKHALYEIYERHIISQASVNGRLSFNDFAGLPNSDILTKTLSLIDRYCKERFRYYFLCSKVSVIPIVWCLIEDTGAQGPNLQVNFGSKCSNNINDAVWGAFLEACQQRLSQIQGTREDLENLDVFKSWPNTKKIINIFNLVSKETFVSTRSVSRGMEFNAVLHDIPGPLYCINIYSGLPSVSTVKIIAPMAKFNRGFF